MRKTKQEDDDFAVLHLLYLIAKETERSAGLHTARVERLLDLLTETTGTVPEDDLNVILERYEFTPRFWYPPSGPQVVYGTTRRNLSREQAWEHWAVALILKFSQDQSLISRIRRCQVCRDRFLAVKNDPRLRFCTTKACRQKWFDQQPERKETKREYAKKYYREQQQRNKDAAKRANDSVRSPKARARK